MTEARARGAMGILALAGAAISAYLVTVRATGGVPICATGGCETVQGSKYSELGGIPVATIGLAGYVLLAATAAVRGPLAAATGLFLALVAAAFSAYLLVVQVAVIDAICQWCLASEVVSFLLLPLAILRVGAVNADAADGLSGRQTEKPVAAIRRRPDARHRQPGHDRAESTERGSKTLPTQGPTGPCLRSRARRLKGE